MVESDWASIGHFLHHLDPNIKTPNKIRMSSLEDFGKKNNPRSLTEHAYIYIYIYIYINERINYEIFEK